MKVKSKPRTKDSAKSILKEIGQGSDEVERSVLSASKIAELKILFDAFPFYVLLLDAKHQILMVNDRLTELLGIDPSKIIGAYCPKVVHNTLEPFPGCPLEESVRTGLDVEKELFDPESEHWVKSGIYPTKFKTHEGQPIYIHFVQDITEHKKTEQDLAESEQKFKAIFEGASDGIATADAETKKFAFVNPRMSEISGYTSSELVGKTIAVIHPKKDLPYVLEQFSKQAEGKIAIAKDIPILTKDGKVIFCDVNSKMMRIGSEDYLVGFFRDVTERKRAEEELRESEKRFRAIFEGASDGIAAAKVETREFAFANPRICEISGYSSNELLGKTIAMLHHKKDVPHVFDQFSKLVEGKISIAKDIPILTKDGKVVICDVSAKMMRIGSEDYLVGFFRDVTERKRAEEELKQSLKTTKRTLKGTVHALASTVEQRDPYTAGHQRRATKLACAIGIKLGLSKERMEGLHVAGTLHDIGKIYVPAEILNKPGRLSDLEMKLVKDHSETGYMLVKEIPFPWPVAQIVIQHHERINGSGYPLGISGEEICLEARILAVADVIEAMASHRPYRPAKGIDEALDEIKKNRGVLYDPKVVDACLKLFADKKFRLKMDPSMYSI